MTGMTSILLSLSPNKKISGPVLSLLGGQISGGIAGGSDNAVFHWIGDGTTRRSINNNPSILMNGATDWILPRDGDLSLYEVIVSWTGDIAPEGSPINVPLSAELTYSWGISGGITPQTDLTVIVREKLDTGNSSSGVYALILDNTP